MIFNLFDLVSTAYFILLKYVGDFSLMENNNTVKISHRNCKRGLLKIRLSYGHIIHIECSRTTEFRREIINFLVTHFPCNEKTLLILIK